MNTIPQAFYDWLSDKLMETNLPQSQASLRAGLNQNAISDIFNHKVKEISLKNCKALAQLFDTPLEEVLMLAGHLESLPDEDLTELRELARLQELMEAARLLSDEDKQLLVRIAQHLPKR